MKFLCAILLVVLFDCNFHSQINVFQDVFHGGVTGDAFNPWVSAIEGQFLINIEPESTVRKAFLFVSTYFTPKSNTLYINNQPVLLSIEDNISNEYLSIYNGDVLPIRTLVYDVTDIIDPNVNQYNTSALFQNTEGFSGIYSDFYLIVAYENYSLPKVNLNIFVNDVQPSATMSYSFIDINPMNTNKNIGLAINSSHICDTIKDGSYVFINNIPIGLIGGQDDGGYHNCSGVMGSFFYKNETLYGLRNDTPDSTMYGTDGLASIESYLNSATSFNVSFIYQSDWGPQTNPIHQLFLTYTSPCDTFFVSVPSDTTICYGESIQLLISGGQSYEWTAVSDTLNGLNALSCTDCPNPIFSGESSQVYTVRIWNNDSCSVVRPIRVWVQNTKPLECYAGESSCDVKNGYIKALSLPNNIQEWVLITPENDTLNSPIGDTYTNLGIGEYLSYYVDDLGCVSEEISIVLNANNNVISDFIISPTTGVAPLEISLENTSQNATNYNWWLNDNFQGEDFTGFLADTAGIYTIQLIAWNTAPLCSDTAVSSILVTDSLIINITEAFSPNGDGKNDRFYIEDVENYPNTKVWIYNRWGSLVYSSENYKNDWYGTGKKGEVLPEGTYYYVVEMGVEGGKKAGWVYLR